LLYFFHSRLALAFMNFVHARSHPGQRSARAPASAIIRQYRHPAKTRATRSWYRRGVLAIPVPRGCKAIGRSGRVGVAGLAGFSIGNDAGSQFAALPASGVTDRGIAHLARRGGERTAGRTSDTRHAAPIQSAPRDDTPDTSERCLRAAPPHSAPPCGVARAPLCKCRSTALVRRIEMLLAPLSLFRNFMLLR